MVRESRSRIRRPDFDDDVIAGACLTHDGVVRHPSTAEALAVLAAENAPGNAPDGASGEAPQATPEEGTADVPDNELADELANDPVKASENEGVV